MEKPTLLFILKAPVVGRVKMRLAEHIGEVRALHAYRAMVEHLFDNLAPHWPFEIHFTPAEDQDLMDDWLGPYHPYFPQTEGHLGDRMNAAVHGAFERGARSVILLGGDCPYVTPETVRSVEHALAGNDTVIGPAADGGYYLFALKRSDPRLFADIAWSTDEVFSATLERIKATGLTVRILPTLEDVDDLPTWTRAEAHLGLRHAASE